MKKIQYLWRNCATLHLNFPSLQTVPRKLSVLVNISLRSCFSTLRQLRCLYSCLQLQLLTEPLKQARKCFSLEKGEGWRHTKHSFHFLFCIFIVVSRLHWLN